VHRNHPENRLSPVNLRVTSAKLRELVRKFYNFLAKACKMGFVASQGFANVP